MKNKTVFVALSILLATIIFYLVIDVFNIDALTGYLIAGSVYGIVSFFIMEHKIFKE